MSVSDCRAPRPRLTLARVAVKPGGSFQRAGPSVGNAEQAGALRYIRHIVLHLGARTLRYSTSFWCRVFGEQLSKGRGNRATQLHLQQYHFVLGCHFRPTKSCFKRRRPPLSKAAHLLPWRISRMEMCRARLETYRRSAIAGSRIIFRDCAKVCNVFCIWGRASRS
jgi:hypothetical protein